MTVSSPGQQKGKARMDRSISFIHSRGAPFERGLHFGSEVRDRVRHSVAAYMEIFRRVASIIFDLTARTIDVAEGPPCEYEYRRVEHRMTAMESTT